MDVYLIADLHLGDPRILRRRHGPFRTIMEHDAFVVASCNAIVDADDVLLILGDLGCGIEGFRSARRLNGRKRLLLGNNDDPELAFASGFLGVPRLHASLFLSGGGRAVLTHLPMHPDELKPDGWRRLNIHGHVHGRDLSHPLGGLYANVSADSLAFRPCRLIDLLSELGLEPASGGMDALLAEIGVTGSLGEMIAAAA